MEQQDTAALLKVAGQSPAGVALEDYNPLEQIPTVAIGKDITEGMSITGTFEETQRCQSAKFVNSQERDPVSGLPVQRLHVFKLLNGQRLGIWSTGELAMVCEKLTPGELISITYKGKGENAQGRPQHFFDYKKAKPAGH